MNFLAIDTSGQHLTVVIKYKDKTEIIYEPSCGVDHSTRLMPAVESIVEKTGANLSEMDFFACAVGAGSFTGIRIGVSTVKALSFAYNKGCLGVTSFDTIAYNVDKEKVLAVIDAKHGNYYACGYQNKKVVLKPCFIDTPTLEKLQEEYPLVYLSDVNPSIGLLNAVCEKAELMSKDINSVKPLYIRKSQAEEGR